MTTSTVAIPPKYRIAEVLLTLSRALDLQMGFVEEHARRVCYMSTRLADKLRLPDLDKANVFYASLLKDIG